MSESPAGSGRFILAGTDGRKDFTERDCRIMQNTVEALNIVRENRMSIAIQRDWIRGMKDLLGVCRAGQQPAHDLEWKLEAQSNHIDVLEKVTDGREKLLTERVGVYALAEMPMQGTA